MLFEKAIEQHLFVPLSEAAGVFAGSSSVDCSCVIVTSVHAGQALVNLQFTISPLKRPGNAESVSKLH
jgi:hypothetical protein